MKEQQRPFFRVLSGSKPTENYLSRAFEACFNESPIFAQCVLTLLWKKCRLPGKAPDGGDWVCDYQPATPDGGRKRPDLLLRLTSEPKKKSPYNQIFIESKLEAKLGEQQLKNYKKSGTKILVAVTKNWPEVPTEKLKESKVNHLRWQDISHALSTATVPSRNAKCRFLCDAFLEYLEYSNMSYREDITLTHMEEVRFLFARIGSPKPINFVPGSSFEVADSCLALLRDARRIAQERSPELAKCANWGPGYYQVETDDAPPEIEWHALGFEIYLKGQYSKSRLLCGLYFSASKPNKIVWEVEYFGHKAKEGRETTNPKPVQRFTSNKKLDASLLATSIIDAFNKWKPF